jgi:hypothetical protein
MTTYLTYADQPPRTESNAEVIANLVRKGWVVSEPPVVEEVAATYSPEAWVSQHFSPMQVSALQRFEMALLQAGKPLGANMTALKGWLEAMLVASVDPTPRSDWQQPPCSYEAASGEAVAGLQA